MYFRGEPKNQTIVEGKEFLQRMDRNNIDDGKYEPLAGARLIVVPDGLRWAGDYQQVTREVERTMLW